MGDVLEEGLDALRRGEATVASLVVAMAWPRFERLGLVSRDAVERLQIPGIDVETRLYLVLSQRWGRDAHRRYLALASELESALNALEREARRQGSRPSPGIR